jgi:hypothetical protein
MRITTRVNWIELHRALLWELWEPIPGEAGERVYERVAKNRPTLLLSFAQLEWGPRCLVAHLNPLRHPKLRISLYFPKEYRPGQVARAVEAAKQFLWKLSEFFLEKPIKIPVTPGRYTPSVDVWSPLLEGEGAYLKPDPIPEGYAMIAVLKTPHGVCERIFYEPSLIPRLSLGVWIMARRHRFVQAPPLIRNLLREIP